jgi:hypothetical protein
MVGTSGSDAKRCVPDAGGGRSSDRALWISWHDLPDAGCDKYLAWLHGKYIPRLLRLPGVLSAAHYEVGRSERPLGHLRRTREALPSDNRTRLRAEQRLRGVRHAQALVHDLAQALQLPQVHGWSIVPQSHRGDSAWQKTI